MNRSMKTKAEKKLDLFLAAHRSDRPGCHCVYGHIDCSYTPNGPCFNEFLSEHPELDEGTAE